MTRVCLVADDDINLQYELLSRETARDALAAYDLQEPFQNSVAVETVSLGAGVALLNDLQWYLVRFVDEAMIFEPSVSDSEWLSRDLAKAIRDGEIDAAESGRFLKVYGLEYPTAGTETPSNEEPDDVETGSNAKTVPEDETTADSGGSHDATATDKGEPDDDTSASPESVPRNPSGPPPRLVEPMYVARTGDRLPEYDLRDVSATLHVRVTGTEFEQ